MTVVVVGAGIAGAHAVKELRDQRYDGDLTLLGAEPHPPYDRPPLSKGLLLGDKEPDAVQLLDDRWYRDHDVDLRTGVPVTGIDLVPAHLEVARAHAQAAGLELSYREIAAEQLAADGSTFDLVCAMEVVEHVADVPEFLATCAALVRPGGRLVVIDPARTRTADLADHHIAPRPGTDAALLLAVVHTLFDEDLVTLGALADHVVGVDEVRALAEELHGAADALQDLADGREQAAGVLDDLLRRGGAGRSRVPVKRGGHDSDFAPVAVAVPDRPGQLAGVLVSAAEAGINVEDVRVEHLAGRPRGVIELLVRADARAEAERLENLRLSAVEARMDALLAVHAPGVPPDLLIDLQHLVAEHWHRERLWGQLMTVLVRLGRRADALATAGFDVRAEPVGATLEPWLEIALPAGSDTTPARTLAAVPRALPTACDPLR